MTAASTTRTDQSFADLLEDVARKLEAGEEVELDKLSEQHREHKDRLQRILPAISAMLEIGHGPDDSSELTDHARKVLGDLRIYREIGRGGMGEVYDAEQISLRPGELR